MSGGEPLERAAPRAKPTPLAALRRAQGWRARDVAVAAGVGDRPVCQLERLQVETLQLGTLVKIAHACGVSAATLVPGLAIPPSRPHPLLAERARPLGAGTKDS